MVRLVHVSNYFPLDDLKTPAQGSRSFTRLTLTSISDYNPAPQHLTEGAAGECITEEFHLLATSERLGKE
jgi:hypothetical protein